MSNEDATKLECKTQDPYAIKTNMEVLESKLERLANSLANVGDLLGVSVSDSPICEKTNGPICNAIEGSSEQVEKCQNMVEAFHVRLN